MLTVLRKLVPFVCLLPGFLIAATPTTAITPASGDGLGQTFQITVTDSDGYKNIQAFNILFQSPNSPWGSNACWIYMQTGGGGNGGTIWLANDDASNWSNVNISSTGGPDVLMSNSQCSFWANQTTIAIGGQFSADVLTVPLTFKSSFAGAVTVYIRAVTTDGLGTGYQAQGTWTVDPNGGAPDFTISASPTSQTVTAGVSTNLNLTFTSMNGFGGQITCTASNLPPGVIANYSNTTCGSFQLSTSRVWPVNLSTNPATTSPPYQPTPPGTYTITFTGTSGSISHSVNFTLIVQSKTITSSVSPNSGTGSSQIFTLTATDSAGYGDLAGVDMLINGSLSSANACWVYQNGQLWLANDDASGWNFVYPGSSSVIENSQCSISGLSYTTNSSGNTVTATFTITFKPAFSGAKTIFLQTVEQPSTADGYQTAGTWTVP